MSLVGKTLSQLGYLRGLLVQLFIQMIDRVMMLKIRGGKTQKNLSAQRALS